MSCNNANTSIQYNQSDYMDTSANTSIDGRTANSNRGQNCVPLMICHMIRHKDNIQIWGMPVRIVTFVAIVDKIDTVGTKVNFHFRDETGSVRGVKWLHADEVNYVAPVKINSYARIYGNVRNINNDFFVNIVEIQPIEHLHELLSHLMEITLVCLKANAMTPITSNANESLREVIIEELANDSLNLNQEQAIIYNIIKCANDTNNGTEREEIKAQVPSYLINKVDGILEFLSSEGHVYTTITDDYFKVI